MLDKHTIKSYNDYTIYFVNLFGNDSKFQIRKKIKLYNGRVYMMRTMKLYEQPQVIVLPIEADIVKTSGLAGGEGSEAFDKSVEDFFGKK